MIPKIDSGKKRDVMNEKLFFDFKIKRNEMLFLK